MADFADVVSDVVTDAKARFHWRKLRKLTKACDVGDRGTVVKIASAHPYLVQERCKQYHMSPLGAAVRRGYLEIVRWLVEESGVRLFRHGRFSPLPTAVRRGHMDVAEYLLEQGFSARENALMAAVEKNNLPMVRVLLAHGRIDPTAGIDYGDPCSGSLYRSPFSTAVRSGHVDIVALMLETMTGSRQGDVNKAESGITPLVSACSVHPKRWESTTPGEEDPWLRIVRLLLSQPAIDVNKGVPLADAARHSPALTMALLAHPDMDATRTRYGKTPLEWADHPACRHLIEEHLAAKASDPSTTLRRSKSIG
mmetsp:Transcript_2192/g.6062  ORF Transcript_2192/g.6062 Transcript_2192/m.6062 type:complete len:310 (+) Transcript_2192:24-953(+)|eukprot:CAMPEP_0119155956 /NCGR_PEP_ID=MMETSP1310-20130426/52013_1 /TAXON_ID=464262 /ORGANISM="Genus nov. species nov., Strain RCC2339" /LENGTH=309 /DNA_ID=CAMNT_0007148563 /DNA_START=115 /DNA_END=1044 /DNA_ORIENTATION=-